MSTLNNPAEIFRHSIGFEKQLAEYTSASFQFAAGPPATPEENQAIELLTLLIKRYDAVHYPVRKAHPLSVLCSLMVERRLTEADLVIVFGDESTVSQVLYANLQMSREHIARLCYRFNVSPNAFFKGANDR